MVNSDDILEIWKVSRYNFPKCYQHVILLNTGEYLCTCFMLVTHGIICKHFFKVFVETPKAYFHLVLIPKRWYKDEYITSKSYSRQISQKQLKFGTLMGEAKKAIQFAIQDDDEELIQFIREYNKRREAQLIQAESIRQQEDLARRKMIANDNRVFHNTRGVLVDSNQIMDPLKHQPKGRPATKRLKSSFEKSGSNKVNTGRKCDLCGENGHYRNTCSKQ
ncbi:unnamed protein product [Rhizophagus irregularis]|nr:unnamed protein product [Rhizophagus irregularis]